MTLSTFLYIVSALCLLNAARLKRKQIQRKREIDRVVEKAILDETSRRVESRRQPSRIVPEYKDRPNRTVH